MKTYSSNACKIIQSLNACKVVIDYCNIYIDTVLVIKIKDLNILFYFQIMRNKFNCLSLSELKNAGNVY